MATPTGLVLAGYTTWGIKSHVQCPLSASVPTLVPESVKEDSPVDGAAKESSVLLPHAESAAKRKRARRRMPRRSFGLNA
jgi:hypothetical protein